MSNMTTFTEMGRMLVDDLATMVERAEEIAVHTKDTGFGDPALYEELGGELRALIGSVDPESEEYTKDEFRGMGLAIAGAGLAVPLLVIEDQETYDVAMAMLTLTHTTIISYPGSFPEPMKDAARIMSSAMNRSGQFERQTFETEEAFCEHVVAQTEANGKGDSLCGHVRLGWIGEPTSQQLFERATDEAANDLDGEEPSFNEVMTRVKSLVEAMGGEVRIETTAVNASPNGSYQA